jgi:hypothetical protein
MVAALAAVLGCGAVVAVLLDPNAGAGFAAVALTVSWLGALALAAVLLLPVLVARTLRGMRPQWPGRRALAAALAVGGLVALPVHHHFYDDASLAAAGGGVGACHGILPLAQVVHDAVADEPRGELYYFASCND